MNQNKPGESALKIKATINIKVYYIRNEKEYIVTSTKGID